MTGRGILCGYRGGSALRANERTLAAGEESGAGYLTIPVVDSGAKAGENIDRHALSSKRM